MHTVQVTRHPKLSFLRMDLTLSELVHTNNMQHTYFWYLLLLEMLNVNVKRKLHVHVTQHVATSSSGI